MNHGIFTFGDEARVSYENMIRFVQKAESYIEKRLGNLMPSPLDLCLSGRPYHWAGCSVIQEPVPSGPWRPPVVSEVRSTPEMVDLPLKRGLELLSGPPTPDHII
jgi:rhamnose utilization protein RhaD (predicted bifunctional aldolase and dehydrogenase)